MSEKYSLSIPQITIKKHDEHGTQCFCELGAVSFDNLDYGHMCFIESVLVGALAKMNEAAAAHPKIKEKLANPGG